MAKYPEDDPNLLNPNRLEGHEGYMLKVLSGNEWQAITGYLGFSENEKEDLSWETRLKKKTVDIPEGAVVMIVAVGETQCFLQEDWSWLDVLYEGDRVRIFHQPSQWMRKFIPWPHGAFIQV